MSRVKTAAETILTGIVDDFTDRRGLRHAWDDIERDIRHEILQTWREIITAVIEDLTGESR